MLDVRHRLAALVAGSILVGCSGGDGDTGEADAGDLADAGAEVSSDTDIDSAPDTDDVPDADTAEDAAEIDTGPERPEDVICRDCTTNEQCGEGNYCLNFPTGGQFCGYDCAGDPSICPSGSVCEELAGGVAQCVPADRICVDVCDGVTCETGQICDPTQDGACVAPLGLCEECELDIQCGENNLCLRFADVDGRTGCALDCTGNPDVCPESYFCAGINTPEGVRNQCIPEIQTCVDRCETVTCDEDRFCDPRTGRCRAAAGPCDPCETDLECGGGGARCLGLTGQRCLADGDCSGSDFCGADGRCVSGRCGVDCSDPSVMCPTDMACFQLADGGAQCLPILLTCEDRCDGVTCDGDTVCDPVTGDCVRPRLGACGSPCTSNDACGGSYDVCLNLDGLGADCTYRCGGDDICPVGYQCLDLFGNGTEFCTPSNFEFECAACAGVTCPRGAECNPQTGQCLALPSPCSFDDETCPDGELCNTFDGRCEPIGIDCTFATRTTACDLGITRCTSARDGIDGTCEQACFGASSCPPDLPACTAFHGVIGSICAPTGIGGADTCGELAPSADPIGQPCDTLDDPRDPSACPSAQAGYCLEGIDPALPGFCTRECADDAGCGASATCEPTSDGSFCVPIACDCATPPLLGEGEPDLLGLAADAMGTSRCELRWRQRDRRDVYGLLELDDPYRLAPYNAASGEPLRALRALDTELDAIGEASSTTALPALLTAAAAWGVPVASPVVEVGSGDAAALTTALNALGADFGFVVDAMVIDATMAEVPAPVIAAIVDLLAPIGDALRSHRSLFALSPALVDIGAIELAATLYAGDSGFDLFDDATSRALVNPAMRRRLVEAGVALAATIEAHRDALVGLTLAESVAIDLPIGDIVIGSSGDDLYTGDEPLLLIELGGADTYRIAAGAATAGVRPVSLVVDVDGADVYGYTGVPVAEDTGLLPSDGAGRAAPVRGGDGRVTLSTVGRQGSGRFGWGMLYDLGAGADSYTTLRYGQGYGLVGVGVLLEEGGGATLAIEALGQGAGLFGIGVLVLGDEGSDVSGLHGVQGHGGAAGVGVLVGGAGDDRYVAAPGDLGADTVIYRDRVGGLPTNLAAAQGGGLGWPAEAAGGSRAVSGGVGVLVERGGNDEYTAGSGAGGFGHWHGVGVLRDLDGDDIYRAAGYAFGAAWQFGGGLHEDVAGTDLRGGLDESPMASMGYGEDLGWGVLLDRDGADTYEGGSLSMGAGVLNGFGLLADFGGADIYRSESNDTLGVALLTLLGREPDDNPRRGLGTFGFLLDADGIDTYERPDVLSPPVGDDRGWEQVPVEEATLPVYGYGLDSLGSPGIDR